VTVEILAKGLYLKEIRCGYMVSTDAQ